MADKRRCGLDTHDLHLLNEACKTVTHKLGWNAYLVGTAAKEAEWRDVDVRVIVPDDEFDTAFGNPGLWELVCFTTCHYLRDVTGLPVDFQIQRMTEANDKHPGGWRNPIGTERRFAGGGDATPF